jgi:hypothetical protein
MITTVATWRCKCGVQVKVVAETDRDRPAGTVAATCPNCGIQQVINAQRILSITVKRIPARP